MSVTTFSLPETMRINGLAELKDQLTPLIEAGEDLELDGAAVSSLDTSGLQLMIAAQNSLQNKGKKLTVINHSEAIGKAVEINGAQEFLNIA